MSFDNRRIYLDYNATAPLLPEARDALVAALAFPGNPSSVHSEGRQARAVVETARRRVAALLGTAAATVVFTSGATEAAATCLSPHWLRDGRRITVDALAVLDTDHPALREGGRFAATSITRLLVDARGIIDWTALDDWLAKLAPDATAMLALCLANGETGVIQPINRIRERIADRDVIFVIDAAQAAGRLPLDDLGADAAILSGHKIGAAKGVGAFVLGRENLRPFALTRGGGQEKGLRSGTEAVPLIAGFGAAASAAARMGQDTDRLRSLCDRVPAALRRSGCLFTLLGEGAERLVNTLALAAPGLKAETAQIALDLQGFAVSAGSACSSGKVGPSHVIQAMAAAGCAADPMLGAIRVSAGTETSVEDVDAFAAAFAQLVRRAQDRDAAQKAA